MHSTRQRDVRSEALRILAVAWRLKGLIKRERHVTGDSKVIERSVDQSLRKGISGLLEPRNKRPRMYLLSLPRTHRRLDLPQAIAHEQGSVDQHAIGRTVDFEVAEQDVGTEEGEDLVDAIIGLAVGSDVHAGGVRGKGGQGVCGTTSPSAQRQDREVPYTKISQFEVFGLTAWAAVAGHRTYHGDIAVLQEDGVVCLEG